MKLNVRKNIKHKAFISHNDFKPGLMVRYTYPNNGYAYDCRHAYEELELGANYVVDHVEIKDFTTDVYLKGFTCHFNSLFFSRAEDNRAVEAPSERWLKAVSR